MSLIIVGDEAYTPEEYALIERDRERRRAYRKRPEVRAARAAYFREWALRNLEHRRAYNRERMRRLRSDPDYRCQERERARELRRAA